MKELVMHRDFGVLQAANHLIGRHPTSLQPPLQAVRLVGTESDSGRGQDRSDHQPNGSFHGSISLRLSIVFRTISELSQNEATADPHLRTGGLVIPNDRHAGYCELS